MKAPFKSFQLVQAWAVCCN